MFGYRVERGAGLVKEQQAHLRLVCHHGPHERPRPGRICLVYSRDATIRHVLKPKHSHRELLHLASAQSDILRRSDPGSSLHSSMIHFARVKHHGAVQRPAVLIINWGMQIRVKSVRQLVDDFLHAAKARSESHLVVIPCRGGVS